MFDLLRTHLLKRIHLTEDKFTRSCQFFLPRKIRKRQFLLSEGEVCRYPAFVTDGCFREYGLDHKGNEHVIQFAIRDWWISDLNSFLSRIPSKRNIDG
jgi:hypothetical protein